MSLFNDEFKYPPNWWDISPHVDTTFITVRVWRNPSKRFYRLDQQRNYVERKFTRIYSKVAATFFRMKIFVLCLLLQFCSTVDHINNLLSSLKNDDFWYTQSVEICWSTNSVTDLNDTFMKYSVEYVKFIKW